MAELVGRVWKFGDDINTDLMMPHVAYDHPPAEQPKFVFSANRPGWSAQVQKGDVILGGANFGTGSSRPAAKQLIGLGIAALVAESINGLFLRNCVNFGLPALACPGILAMFEEGDIAAIDYPGARVANRTRGTTIAARRLPAALVELTLSGGIVPLLEREGYLDRDR